MSPLLHLKGDEEQGKRGVKHQDKRKDGIPLVLLVDNRPLARVNSLRNELKWKIDSIDSEDDIVRRSSLEDDTRDLQMVG